MATTNNLKGTSFSSFRIGKGGPTIYQGNTAPNGVGTDGDLYIRTGTLPRFYQKISGFWVQLDSTLKVVQVKNTDYQTAQPDQVVLMNSINGPRTVTLGNTSVLAGKEVIVKDAGGAASTNPITIMGQGGQTIDGQNSLIINQDRESVTLMCDGSNWYVV
jgi:hypothetical protein